MVRPNKTGAIQSQTTNKNLPQFRKQRSPSAPIFHTSYMNWRLLSMERECI
uniref:Uncharacterized protein n=1 Tax=Anguilla anguilla TaxID=7936 RepID=A0A0E9XI16_ANGAN